MSKCYYDIHMEVTEYSDGRISYYVNHPALLGCQSDGETANEAVWNLADARREYQIGYREDGVPLPAAHVDTFPDGSVTYYFSVDL